jgi:hypothetical protein
MCPKSVKNRQGGLKLFFVLIFWLLLDQAKSNSPAAIERARVKVNPKMFCVTPRVYTNRGKLQFAFGHHYFAGFRPKLSCREEALVLPKR